MKGTAPATAALLAATAVWGSTFIVTKGHPRQAGPGLLPHLALRHRGGGTAAVSSTRSGTPGADRAEAVRAAGRRPGHGFLLQTTGLQHTLAGVSGFLTGAAVILTPILAATFFGARVGRGGWAAVALSAAGIAALAGGVSTPLVAGRGPHPRGRRLLRRAHHRPEPVGDPRERLRDDDRQRHRRRRPLRGRRTARGPGITAPATAAGWQAVLYLGIVATCIGFGVQAWAQSALTATTAAVVMTMEPVFAAVLAVVLGESGLGRVGWAGGLLVVTGMALAELGPRQCRDAIASRVECC